MILVQRRIDRRDDALAERITQSVVYDRWQNAKTRCDVAIDLQAQARPRVLSWSDATSLSSGIFLKRSRKIADQRFSSLALASTSVYWYWVFGDATADGDVLRRLHVEGDFRNLRELGLQPGDHLIGGRAAFGLRLQSNEDTTLI